MGHLNFGLSAVVVSALALAGCATNSPQQDATPSALPQPELPARVRPAEIVGRYGYAAYHDAKDRARLRAGKPASARPDASPDELAALRARLTDQSFQAQ